MRIGSSPILPILAGLFALALFCYAQMNRIYLAARQEPRGVRGLETAFQNRLDRYRNSLSSNFGSRFGLIRPLEWTCVAFGCLIAFGLAFSFHPYRNLESSDGSPFNLLLVCMEVLLVGTLLHGCVQMVSTWLDLKSLLASLAGLPLATAFIARSRVRSKRPLWVQNLSLQSLSTLVRGPLILHDIWLRRPMIFQVAQGGKTIDLYKDYGEKIRSLITGTEKPDESPTDALAEIGGLAR